MREPAKKRKDGAGANGQNSQNTPPARVVSSNRIQLNLYT